MSDNISTTRTEARLFVSHWWSYRHDSSRHFRLVREALRDMRAATKLIGK